MNEGLKILEEIREAGRAEGREKGREEGREEGRLAGERRVLLRQLEEAFGQLPAAVQARVEAAGESELEAWALRVLRARSLEEVFSPAP